MALDTFTESLYSLYIASVQWEVSMLPTSYVWADLMAQATASQLLAYLKLCGVEQATIARTFGVSPTAVSMWVRGHRPMPLRYGPVLARLLQQTAREAAHRVQQAVRRHNTPVRQQIEQDASEAPFVRWAEDVLRTRQTQEERLRRLLEQLGAYAQQAAWPSVDLDSIGALCVLLQRQLGTVRRQERPPSQ